MDISGPLVLCLPLLQPDGRLLRWARGEGCAQAPPQALGGRGSPEQGAARASGHPARVRQLAPAAGRAAGLRLARGRQGQSCLSRGQAAVCAHGGGAAAAVPAARRGGRAALRHLAQRAPHSRLRDCAGRQGRRWACASFYLLID